MRFPPGAKCWLVDRSRWSFFWKWPFVRKIAGDSAVVFEIPLSGSETDEEVIDMVCSAAYRLDRKHRELGGHGLKIHSVNIVEE